MDFKTPTVSSTSGKAGMTKGNFAHSADDSSVCHISVTYNWQPLLLFEQKQLVDNYDLIPVIIRGDQDRHHWRFLEDMDMDSNAR